jgi:hypothetical protein
VTLNGITGEKDNDKYNAAEAERHDLLTGSGVHILALSKTDLSSAGQSPFGLQGALKRDLETLLYGKGY